LNYYLTRTSIAQVESDITKLGSIASQFGIGSIDDLTKIYRYKIKNMYLPTRP
jgi:hypothetical protein